MSTVHYRTGYRHQLVLPYEQRTMLLAFVGLKARDSRRYYCYEWAYHAITGRHPTGRVMPETLLELAAQSKGAAHAD